MGVVKLNQIMSNFLTLSNKQSAACKLLHYYVLNMPNIYKESSEGIIINSNINISTGFLLISNEPIKILQLKKLANQSIFNGAFMIEMIRNSFYESKNNFLLIKKEISN